MPPRISIRGLVRPSVGWSVRQSVGNAFVKIDEKWPFMDSKWLRQCWTRKKEEQGGRRDEEEGGARRKERRGGRSDEESEKMKSCKKMKNEKVAWGRIVDLWVLFHHMLRPPPQLFAVLSRARIHYIPIVQRVAFVDFSFHSSFVLNNFFNALFTFYRLAVHCLFFISLGFSFIVFFLSSF